MADKSVRVEWRGDLGFEATSGLGGTARLAMDDDVAGLRPSEGVLVALGLFLALFLVLVRIARRATDPFSSLTVFGIVGLFFTHVFENVGMTVNLMPITGIPLPMFSYGGSFFIICSLCLGLALRVARDSRLSGYTDA